MIEFINNNDILSHICKATNKWGMLISFSTPEWNADDENWHPFDEVLKAAPYLNVETHMQILADGTAYILADSIEEIYNLYDQTVGDSGSRGNAYNGPAKVYALTCDPSGDFISENS